MPTGSLNAFRKLVGQWGGELEAGEVAVAPADAAAHAMVQDAECELRQAVAIFIVIDIE